VVEDGTKVLAAQVASSAEMHLATGGIVPEVAARRQVDFMVPVLEATLAQLTQEQTLDAVAVTVGPGLVGSLIVGIEAAKALALAWHKPILPVNHLVGHIYANFIDSGGAHANAEDVFPAVALVVSGGHTDLVLMRAHGDLHYLGGTLDDAAGEAFDKVARLLQLGTYLGGATLAKTARDYAGPVIPEKLPRALLHDTTYNFSFSGLKTATKRLVDKGLYPIPAIAQEFEKAVIDVLVAKTAQAAKATHAKSILLGGGVSANQHLRQELVAVMRSQNSAVRVHIPPAAQCTDNAAYIASAAYFYAKHGKSSVCPFANITPNPALTIMTSLSDGSFC
jgi:N6-L-threonylcarbamoyladenine synthase